MNGFGEFREGRRVKRRLVEDDGHEYGSAKPLQDTVFRAPKLESLPTGPTAINSTSSQLPGSELDLSLYLPEVFYEAYRSLGKKTSLFPWQAECLGMKGVLDGQSVVYCAPTSAGKSLVAEILMLRRLHQTGRAAMLVLPFVALCTEKAHLLEELLRPIQKQIKRFYGPYSSRIIFSEMTGVLVCTIEKANLLVNRMIEEDLLPLLSTVVVDELHMVDDQHRGYLLELLLTKLRYMSQKRSDIDLQIVGMSATMPNGEDIARWLGAELYVTQTRPVPLKQFLKIGLVIYNEKGKEVRRLKDCLDPGKDPDHVAKLAKETVDENHSVLIFCCSKKACEVCAQQISSLFTVPFMQKPNSDLTRESIVEELKGLTAGFHPILPEVILKGVAFHHAGLSSEERSLVELAYKKGFVSILTATSTLAAGVNLPARRVIFKQPYVGLPTNVLDSTKYRQMAGRAGRAGIDEVGEAFLLESKHVPKEKLQKLIESDAQTVTSCLLNERDGLTRLLLEVISSGAVQTGKDVEKLIDSTLLSKTEDSEKTLASATKTSLGWLAQQKLIYWESANELNNHAGQWTSHPLGNATVSSGMHPEESALVKMDLQEAMQTLVLSSDLQLTYLVTPYNIEVEINWGRFYFMFNNLSLIDTGIADLVGVSMVYVQGKYKGVTNEDPKEALKARRFFAALILRDLINEVPLVEICRRFDQTVGTVEALQEKAHRYATMTAAFCGSLGWISLKIVISEFQKRIYGAARPEIVHLTEIPFVKSKRARLLYKAGFRTVESIAAVDSNIKIAKALVTERGATPNDRDLGIAEKIIRNAKVLIFRQLNVVQEETKTAAKIVGEETTMAASELSVDCLRHDLDSVSHGVISAASTRAPEGELSTQLRRMSFQPTPFLNAEGIVLLRVKCELQSLMDFFRIHHVVHVGVVFDSNGLAFSWSDDLVVFVCISDLDAGSRKHCLLLELLRREYFQKGVFGFPSCCPWLDPDLADVSSFPLLLEVKTAGSLLGVKQESLQTLKSLFLCFNSEERYQQIEERISTASEQTCGRSQVFTPCLEATLVCVISRILRQKLEEMKMWELYINIENPLIQLLHFLDNQGVLLDRNTLLPYLESVQYRLGMLKEASERLGGPGLDPDKDSLIKERLEKSMEICLDSWDDSCFWKNEKQLRNLQDQHPLPSALLEYRTLKLRHQDLTSVLQTHPSERLRLRLSRVAEMRYMKNQVSEIQELPLQEVVFAHQQVWISTEAPSLLGFLPCLVPRLNYVLVVGQFVDLDLFLFAHLSQVEEICQVVGEKRVDPFHALTASWLRNSPEKIHQVEEREIRFCKTLIHGFLQGLSPLLNARRLQISEGRSKEISKGFLRKFKGVDLWIEKLLDDVQNGLGVKTLYGRQLPVEWTDREETTRKTIRSVIHGSISEILKLSMIQINQKLTSQLNNKASLLLQDGMSIVMEVETGREEEGVRLMRDCMEEASMMKFPVKIDIKTGQNWSDLKNS